MQRRAVTYRYCTCAVLLAVCFTTAPWVFAGEQPQKAENPRKDSQKSHSDEGAAVQELQLLKQQLASQQAQIEQLRVALEQQRQMLERALQSSQSPTEHSPNLGEVASTRPAVPGASAGPASAPAIGGPGGPSAIAQAARDEAKVTAKKVDALEKSVGTLSKGLGNFSLSGDVRVRYETFIQDGTETRNRQRIRARLNLTGKVSDDMFGGISFGSGDLSDPISTNQTETTFFLRKPFYLDRAYLTINPRAFRALSITGGRQAYPWYRTELTWDNDLNPEGFSQTLSLNSKSFLKNVTVVGYQLPFNEVSGGPDGFIYGGQLQLKFNAGEKGTFELYGGGTRFSRADSIAVAQDTKVVGGNGLTNTVLKDANGKVTGYAGEFLYFTATARAGYKMSARWPLLALFDFVQNTKAATNQRKGYLAEIGIGQQTNPKDIRFRYQYFRIEKDSVISAFNFSDLRTPTDVENHVFFVGYQIVKNVSGEWTYLLGKRLNDSSDNWLSRMQFDLVYKF